MIPSAALCRAQESLHLQKAAGTSLENVRRISTQAATAWGREAMIAEQREGRRSEARVFSKDAYRPGNDASSLDEIMMSENPDRGRSTMLGKGKYFIPPA